MLLRSALEAGDLGHVENPSLSKEDSDLLLWTTLSSNASLAMLSEMEFVGSPLRVYPVPAVSGVDVTSLPSTNAPVVVLVLFTLAAHTDVSLGTALPSLLLRHERLNDNISASSSSLCIGVTEQRDGIPAVLIEVFVFSLA